MTAITYAGTLTGSDGSKLAITAATLTPAAAGQPQPSTTPPVLGSPTAVQIGDPIQEKKVLDVLMQARNRGLYSAASSAK